MLGRWSRQLGAVAQERASAGATSILTRKITSLATAVSPVIRSKAWLPSSVGASLSRPCGQQERKLHIHEYQSMNLLKKYDISHPRCGVAATAEEAEALASTFKGKDFVVKAMVLTGGRGKGRFLGGLQGGVQLCTGAKAVKEIASRMLGDRLVTKQSGPEGKPVYRVLVTERLYLRQEKYFGIVMDRAFGGPVLIGSPAGGMDIEQVAHDTPHLIYKEPIDIEKGVTAEQVNRFAMNLGFDSELTQQQAVKIITNLYKLFIATDCTLVEINPMAETHDGRVLCIDAKLNFDDNAFFRQKDLVAMRDPSQEDPREVEADKYGLNYIGLDGSIGCLVNGAGLAMATMDIIKLQGGSPANFLDIGGGANATQVTQAFSILNNDPQVKAILVNIFGGIMRCDTIAYGLIKACTTLGMKKPIVVRLQGTNVSEATKLIEDSGLRIMTAPDLGEAAAKVVRIVQILRMAEEAAVGVSFELPLST